MAPLFKRSLCLLAFSLLAVGVGCKKDPPKLIPTLTTSVANITSTTVTATGNVESDGGADITTRGFCWNTLPDPTIINQKTTDVTGASTFISTITGLIPGMLYYVRSYAVNSVGTGYGNTVTVTTPAVTATITTSALTAVSATTATCGGNILNDGGALITARGVCWDVNQNPTVLNAQSVMTDSEAISLNAKTTDGTGTGMFTSSITGLTPGSRYYFRAYATNSAGTSYGNQVVGTTNAVIPTLTTTTASNITASSFTTGGAITFDGGSTVSARGVCWSTAQNPTVADNKTNDGTGPSSFISTITGLSAGTTYYVRAYATNSMGTAYGNQITVMTLATFPTLTTSALTAVSATTAICGGNILNDGGALITARGVCWDVNQNPTILNAQSVMTDIEAIPLNAKTTDGTGTGMFTSSITGLTPGTKYYFRAYATNIVGTSYGNQIVGTTNAVMPTLTTITASNITESSFTTGGAITFDGGATVSARGVCWSTAQNPTISNNKTNDGTGPSSFISTITGLSAGTTYYVRAYATNSMGTAYGNQITVMTLATLPTITTLEVIKSTETTATGGGIILSDGGSPITSRGVCWSTYSNPTISNNKTSDGSGFGSFTSFLTGLTPLISYYVKAYATNFIGTSYGNQIIYNPNAVIPSLTVTSASSITTTSAASGGIIISDGGAIVSAKGVCWSTNIYPTIFNNHTSDGSGTGSYLSIITNLIPGGTYYVRAYATNYKGTGYSDQIIIQTRGFTLELSDGHGIAVSEEDLSVKYNWYNSQSICESLVLYGHSDWRLPTINELEKMNQNFYLKGKGNFKTNDGYWSSSVKSGASRAYYFDFSNGTVSNPLINYYDNYSDGYVRPVRSF